MHKAWELLQLTWDGVKHRDKVQAQKKSAPTIKLLCGLKPTIMKKLYKLSTLLNGSYKKRLHLFFW